MPRSILTDTDVVVVGGGLGGCIAAKRVADLGHRVCVVDRTVDPPNEFRAEQIVGAQVDRLRALGVLEPMIEDAVWSGITTNARRGGILDRTRVEQYGLAYRSMVLGVRSVLPRDAMVIGRVTAIETTPSVQTVHLADGRAMTTRLVVVATGLMPQILATLGIGSMMVSEAHSLCLGFDMAFEPPVRADLMPLIYYGERVEQRIDYLALFQIGAAVRANLFAYHPRRSAWVRDFASSPDDMLRAAMPGLARIVGSSTVTSPVLVRDNDIKVATNVRRDGVVVIGDAFQTPCPAAGTGIDRILSDVDALGRCLPAWLARDERGAATIAQFYDDPAKQAFDAECIRIARYRRAAATERGLRWRLHRRRVALQRRLECLTGPHLLTSVYARLGRIDPMAGHDTDGERPASATPV